VGGRGGAIRFYDLASGQPLRTLTIGATPNDLVFDPTGAYLAVSSPKAPQVQVWSLLSGQAIAKLFHPAEVAGIAWRDDGQLLACACSDQNIYLWSTKEPFSGARTNAIAVLHGHQAQARSVTFSHDGSLLVSFGWDTIVRLWDVGGGRQILAFQAYG